MKKEKKSRAGKQILLLILLLVIGFASVTTTLIITGTIKIGYNEENFAKNVVFTSAKITYSDGRAEAPITIPADGAKSFSFTIDGLETIGETATIEYVVRNKSQYGANLNSLSCKVWEGTSETDKGMEVTNAALSGQTEIADTNPQKYNYISLTEPEGKAIGGTLDAYTGEGTFQLQAKLIRSYAGVASNETEAEETKSYFVECKIEPTPIDAERPATE